MSVLRSLRSACGRRSRLGAGMCRHIHRSISALTRDDTTLSEHSTRRPAPTPRRAPERCRVLLLARPSQSQPPRAPPARAFRPPDSSCHITAYQGTPSRPVTRLALRPACLRRLSDIRHWAPVPPPQADHLHEILRSVLAPAHRSTALCKPPREAVAVSTPTARKPHTAPGAA
jgi:hypothetical protein